MFNVDVMVQAFTDEMEKLAYGYGNQNLNSWQNSVPINTVLGGVGAATGARLGGIKSPTTLAIAGLGGALGGGLGIAYRRNKLMQEQGLRKSAGVFSALGKAIANRGATATNAVAHAAPAATQVATPTAAQAGKSTLMKAAPYLAAGGAGALGYQQLRKAGKDWETGRAMRLQADAYSPT